MTLGECITHLDGIKPNAFPFSDKVRWINGLYNGIRQGVWLCPAGEGFSDAAEELPLYSPHDELFTHWLAAQIDFADGEYGRYQNSMAMFNRAWSEYVRWFIALYDPSGENAGLTPLGEVTGEGETVILSLAPGDMLLELVCRVETPFGEESLITVGTGEDPLLTCSGERAGISRASVLLSAEGQTDITVTRVGSGGRALLYGRVLRRLRGAV